MIRLSVDSISLKLLYEVTFSSVIYERIFNRDVYHLIKYVRWNHSTDNSLIAVEAWVKC